MQTTASLFLNTLARAGVTHAFVNWGNDHPAILEELERQRVEDGHTTIQIVTCPNEMVGLSAAQAFTQVTGTSSLVIVHVDVGTQALGGAVHNVDRGRAPVIIFSGLAPFSAQGEHKGSKNEWPMWVQDVPDQTAIVRQYMRFSTQIMSGKSVAKTTLRALQFANSGPKGPVYISARRETLEEEIEPSTAEETIDLSRWPPISPEGLSSTAAKTIIDALSSARFPLVIVAHSGRNTRTVAPLVELCDKFAAAVFMSCGSSVCIPYSHPSFLGNNFGGKIPLLDEADTILIIDTDIPWIDAWDNAPQKGSRVFVIDPDPLKQSYGWSHVDAELLCRADSEVALGQLLEAAKQPGVVLDAPAIAARAKQLKLRHDEFIAGLKEVERSRAVGDVADVAHVLATLRQAVVEKTPSHGERTLWLNEAISSYHEVYNHIRPNVPGSMITSGGTSLGWALGAAVGAYLGNKSTNTGHDLLVAVVGDGTFMFCVPSSAYWMARKYNTPYLTIVLNNGGWAVSIDCGAGDTY
ncbi:thiamine pyrophosphate enzyme, N-terminal TPP binding domain-containing protein [Cytidiella melzeri]|nr:thiamine pyrophosphate enzyme, N-terminal TPP binding domain-containing protein [Cytidiella melzeri]